MVDAFCDKLTCLIRNNVQDIDEIINFGIKSIFSEISKAFIILLTAYFLGILHLAVIAMVATGIYRSLAGGAHARSHIACLATSMTLIFSNIYISGVLAAYGSINIEYIYLFIFLFNSIIIYVYAPGDTEEKPILSKKLRHRLKINSFIALSLIVFIAITFIKTNIVANVIILSTFFQSLTLLPVSYKIMKCKHGHEIKI